MGAKDFDPEKFENLRSRGRYGVLQSSTRGRKVERGPSGVPRVPTDRITQSIIHATPYISRLVVTSRTVPSAEITGYHRV